VDEALDQRVQELLAKLQRALEAAGRDRLGACGLEERVALMEIAGTIANLITKTRVCSSYHPKEILANKIQQTNRASVLKLPLTEDLWLKHSVDLSTSYYRNIMISGAR
jgi:nuclear pore complex protein Nup98-Nup96